MIRRSLAVTAALLATAMPTIDAHAAGAAFSAQELATIEAFYRQAQERHRGGGKGGARNGLPPGIASNLERGKALPPGLATAGLPPALESALPPAPDGYERVVVDTKILLVETATRTIHDVITAMVLN